MTQAALDSLSERMRHLETQEPGDHAKARTDAAQNIPNNVWTTVIFEDEDYDSGAEYNPATGTFTVGRDGMLHVTSAIMFTTTAAWAVTEYAALGVQVNAAGVDIMAWKTGFAAGNIYVQVHGSTTVQVSAGDAVTVVVRQTSGGALALHNNSLYNYVCFDWWS